MATGIVHDSRSQWAMGHRGAMPPRRCIWRATRRYSPPMTHPKPLMCAVELGGTKCECLVGTSPDDIRERITVRTERDAAATLRRIAGVLRRSEEHTSELQSPCNLVCRLLLEKKKS